MRCAETTVIKATWAAIMSMAASVTLADGISTSVSGYGTVGGTFTSDGHYAYFHNETEFTGASNSFDVGLDSRIGVQAVVSFDSQWSVTAQELAKLRGDSNFHPDTEWLFAQYQPDSDLKLRLGRVVLPVFLLSDTINVGYAAPWFNAPNDVYYAEPYEYLDGGQLLWQHSLGAFQLGLEGTYGETDATLGLAGTEVIAKSKNTFDAAVSLSWRNLLIRYAETRLNSATTVLASATKTFSLTVHDRFHCAGLQYDDGKALLMSEWIKRDEDNLVGFNKPFAVDTSWYVAAGWHFGRFMPLGSYSVLDITDSIVQKAARYSSWGASLRYDVVRNVDLKLQINRAQAGDSAYWVVAKPSSNERVNVYSIGADFVF
jgi:hypothetical protein